MKILTESKNYVIFEDIANERVLYEKVFNTIHNADDGINEIKKMLDNYDHKVDFKKIKPNDLSAERFDSLALNVTEDCNMRCGYCIYSGLYEDERTHSKKYMDMEIAILAIDEFLSKSKENPKILFYGGEPLMNMDVIKGSVELAKKDKYDKNVEFGLTTNFTLAEKNLDFLTANNFIILISLDGDKKVHDRFRKDLNGKGTFDKIYRDIKNLEANDPEYYNRKVGFSVTLADPLNLLEVYEFFSDPLFRNNPVIVQSIERRFMKRDITNYDMKREKGDEQILKLANKYVKNIIECKDNNNFLRALFDQPVYFVHTLSGVHIPSELNPRGMCKPGFRKLFVNTNGTYYTCEKIGRRSDLGNVFDGFDLQKSVDLYNKYSDIKAEICNDCWATRACNSCVSTAKSKREIDVEGQKKMCGQLKEQIIKGLSIYSYLLKEDVHKKFKDYYSKIDILG